MYRGCELKAFCLAFAFVLVALPASANELPQTSNAWRAIEPDLADPGNFKWTVLDNSAGGDQTPAAVGARWVDSRELRESTAAKEDRIEPEIAGRFVTISPS